MVILILVAIFIFASYLTAFMRLQFDFQFQQTPQKAALSALFVPVLLPILIERRRENPCFSVGGYVNDSIFEDAKKTKTFHYVVICRNILNDKLFD